MLLKKGAESDPTGMQIIWQKILGPAVKQQLKRRSATASFISCLLKGI